MTSAGKEKSRPGYVRIIGGRWRRQRIVIPRGVELRPTPDRVRETLFSWLGPMLPGASCLDLFAGTGVLGFEALSRGARRAVMVESNPRAAAALDASVNALEANARILRTDATAFLAHPDGTHFDVVFVDPPYAMPVDAVFAALPHFLNAGARIYLERERSAPWPELEGFDWLRRGTAGAVAFGLAAFSAEGGV